MLYKKLFVFNGPDKLTFWDYYELLNSKGKLLL